MALVTSPDFEAGVCGKERFFCFFCAMLWSGELILFLFLLSSTLDIHLPLSNMYLLVVEKKKKVVDN